MYNPVEHSQVLRSAHTVCLCFVWILEQTVIISLCGINWLVFITGTGKVYCTVRAGSLNVIHVYIYVTWTDLLSNSDRVRYRLNPCGVCAV
jgi:hypothetical protein